MLSSLVTQTLVLLPLAICLSVCLFVFLFACLSVFLYFYLSVCLPAFKSSSLSLLSLTFSLYLSLCLHPTLELSLIFSYPHFLTFSSTISVEERYMYFHYFFLFFKSVSQALICCRSVPLHSLPTWFHGLTPGLLHMSVLP